MKKWWLPLAMVVPFALGGAATQQEEPSTPRSACEGKESPSGVVIQQLEPGLGPALAEGRAASWRWRVTDDDGAPLAEPHGDWRTLTCAPEDARLIEGWRQGTRGMRQGELRRLIIPPALAYGEQGRAPMIPPGATVTLEVELLDVLTGPLA